jgi:hypothetical protein
VSAATWVLGPLAVLGVWMIAGALTRLAAAQEARVGLEQQHLEGMQEQNRLTEQLTRVQADLAAAAHAQAGAFKQAHREDGP